MVYYLISSTANWYEHHPEQVAEGNDVSILWDFPVHTLTELYVQANRPNIIVKDKKDYISLLIDISVPSDNTVAAKVFEKLSKYRDLEIEIDQMWDLKTKTLPVVVGALGLIRKGTADIIDKIPGSPSLSEVQKIVLNSTAHVFEKRSFHLKYSLVK